MQEPRSHKQTLVLLGLNRQQPDSAMASVPAAMMTVIALLMVVFMVYLRLISDGNAILADAAGDMHFLNESMLSNVLEFIPDNAHHGKPSPPPKANGECRNGPSNGNSITRRVRDR